LIKRKRKELNLKIMKNGMCTPYYRYARDTLLGTAGFSPTIAAHGTDSLLRLVLHDGRVLAFS